MTLYCITLDSHNYALSAKRQKSLFGWSTLRDGLHTTMDSPSAVIWYVSEQYLVKIILCLYASLALVLLCTPCDAFYMSVGMSVCVFFTADATAPFTRHLSIVLGCDS